MMLRGWEGKLTGFGADFPSRVSNLVLWMDGWYDGKEKRRREKEWMEEVV